MTCSKGTCCSFHKFNYSKSEAKTNFQLKTEKETETETEKVLIKFVFTFSCLSCHSQLFEVAIQGLIR